MMAASMFTRDRKVVLIYPLMFINKCGGAAWGGEGPSRPAGEDAMKRCHEARFCEVSKIAT
jgi:hypothetical protein